MTEYNIFQSCQCKQLVHLYTVIQNLLIATNLDIKVISRETNDNLNHPTAPTAELQGVITNYTEDQRFL